VVSSTLRLSSKLKLKHSIAVVVYLHYKNTNIFLLITTQNELCDLDQAVLEGRVRKSGNCCKSKVNVFLSEISGPLDSSRGVNELEGLDNVVRLFCFFFFFSKW
jgi:hypothetical protein